MVALQPRGYGNDILKGCKSKLSKEKDPVKMQRVIYTKVECVCNNACTPEGREE
jgi:hypothetical protein